MLLQYNPFDHDSLKKKLGIVRIDNLVRPTLPVSASRRYIFKNKLFLTHRHSVTTKLIFDPFNLKSLSFHTVNTSVLQGRNNPCLNSWAVTRKTSF